MKNNKGFTLVELLAVIAILAILVIITLPNVVSLFNEAKKDAFLTECKQIFKTAQNQWMSDSMFETKDQVYKRCKTCTGKSLKMSGRQEIEYYIKINKAGKVVTLQASDGTYQFIYNGNDLKIEDIIYADSVSNLAEDEVVAINDSGIIFEKSYYVSSTGSDSNTGNEQNPLLTISEAINKLGNRNGVIYITSDLNLEDLTYYIQSNVTLKSSGSTRHTISLMSGTEFSSVLRFEEMENSNGKVFIQDLIVNGGGVRGVQSNGVDLELSNVDIKNGHLSEYSGICLGVSRANVVLNNTNFDDCKGAVGGAMELINVTMTMNGGSVNNSSGNMNQGSAMSFNNTRATFNNTTFDGNYSSNKVALASINSSSKVVFNSVTATNTTSRLGGMTVSGELEINNSTFDGFVENTVYGQGSVVIVNSGGKLTVNNSTFSNNESNLGSLRFSNNSNVNIKNSTFTGNTANYGGSIEVSSGANVVITDTTFRNNTANMRTGGSGGAILTAGTLSLNNCIIENNVAGKVVTTSTSRGGGISITDGVTTINGGRIINNTADVGSDVDVGTTGSLVNNGANIGTCNGC